MQLLEQGEIDNLSGLVDLLKYMLAECQSLIGAAIPGIINSLSDNDSTTREACTSTLSILLQQSKTAKIFNLFLLIKMIAEFHSLIGPAIPGIVGLLKDSKWHVCLTCAQTLSTLLVQGLGKTGNLLGLFCS